MDSTSSRCVLLKYARLLTRQLVHSSSTMARFVTGCAQNRKHLRRPYPTHQPPDVRTSKRKNVHSRTESQQTGDLVFDIQKDSNQDEFTNQTEITYQVILKIFKTTRTPTLSRSLQQIANKNLIIVQPTRNQPQPQLQNGTSKEKYQ